MHRLGESVGPLLNPSEILLSAKDREIDELKKRCTQLEALNSNLRNEHTNEANELIALLNSKDAALRAKVKELDERPPRELIYGLWEELRILEAESLEKTKLLETAQKNRDELRIQIKKHDSELIPASEVNQQPIYSKPPETGGSTRGIWSGPISYIVRVFSSAVLHSTTPVPVISSGPVQTKRKFSFFRRVEGVDFDLEDLLRASAEVLGKGTFGSTYKAGFESGKMVAVKRLKDVNVPEKTFLENMAKLGELEHKNVVPFIAYYFSKEEKLLVSDFMVTRSLSTVLHGQKGSGRSLLNWEMRARMALAVSQALLYIHSSGPTSSHGNIKSSNVLLTPSFEARLSDPGLYTLANPQVPFTRFTGTRAPEITISDKSSQKADVYSFGILGLELLTGKSPAEMVLNVDQRVDLPKWVHSVLKDEWTNEVFDMELVRDHGAGDGMMQMLKLALDCTVQHPDDRPGMAEVVAHMEEIVKSVDEGEKDRV